MTAPGGGVSGLINTIVTLKTLQQRDEAARLAREEFGLQQNMSQEEAVAHLQNILSNTQDPTSLLPHVDEFAKRTGFSVPALETIIKQASPSLATTAGGVVARGVKRAGPQLEDVSAYTNIAHTMPGAVSEDEFNKLLFGEKSTLLQNLGQKDKEDLLREAMSKSLTGMSLGEAAIDAIIPKLPKEQLQQAALIGAKLAPSATELAQIKLGLMENEIRSNTASSEDAYRTMMAKAAMIEANARMKAEDPQRFKLTQDLLKQRDQYLQYLGGGANKTSTPEGRVINAQQVNAYNEMLRQIAPELYGPNGKIPLKDVTIEQDKKGNVKPSTTTTTSPFLDWMGRRLQP
jgi:hypothetical protein